MIKIVEGDAIKAFSEANFNILLHGCNCRAIWGAGFAKQLKEKYPEAYEVDIHASQYGRNRPGMFTIARVNESSTSVLNTNTPEFIVNLYTQISFGTDRKYFEESYYRSALHKFAQHFDESWSIGMPKIGSGLGGGNWDEILEITDEIIGDRDVTVYSID